MLHIEPVEAFLTAGLPVIDVRSPGEFKQGHIPGAHNLPLFTNEERAVVGTRQLVDAAPQMPIGSHILLERDIQVKLVGSPEHVEGTLAFREKRPARFAKS